LGNITLGNGTLTARYTQIGKTVHFEFLLIKGTTTTFNASQATFTLPVAPSTAIGKKKFFGSWWWYTGIGGTINANLEGAVFSGSVCSLFYRKDFTQLHELTSSANIGSTSIINGDQFTLSGTYEAA